MKTPRIFFLLLCPIMLVVSCSHSSFQYRLESDMHLDSPNKKDGFIEAESAGFVWESCKSVNKKAIQNLRKQLSKDQHVYSLEWYDFATNRFQSSPRCKTEQGWVYTFYLFWWPSATKVKVRGVIGRKPVDSKPSDESKLVGSDEYDCSIQVENLEDKFENYVTISAYRCSDEEGTFSTEAKRGFLRIFLNKEKPYLERYTIYSIYRVGDWPRLKTASYIVDGKVKNAKISDINKDVDCSGGSCWHTIDNSFDISKKDFITFVKSKSPIEYKLKGIMASPVFTIPKVQIEEVNRVLIQTRKKIKRK